MEEERRNFEFHLRSKSEIELAKVYFRLFGLNALCVLMKLLEDEASAEPDRIQSGELRMQAMLVDAILTFKQMPECERRRVKWIGPDENELDLFK